MALAVWVLGSSCLVDVHYDDTRFRCEDSPECPDGYTCTAGTCEPEGTAPADASPQAPDAAPAVDSPVAPDAALPDALGVATLSFGETGADDSSGVTTDTELREDAPSNNYGARAAIGVDETPRRAGLVRFDLSAIPAGATVVDATLILWTTADGQEEGSIRVFRLLEPWDEGDEVDVPGFANYAFRTMAAGWTALGAGPGSSDDVILADFEPRTPDTEWVAPLAVAAVQAWVDDPATNFGLLLFSANANGRGCQFHSSESDEVDRRPRLIVSFTAPSE